MTALDDAPAHWTRTTIGEIAEVSGGIQKQPSRKPRNNTAPFLRVANVQHGRLALDDVHQVELFDGELDRYRLASGDLLVVEGNGSLTHIGRSALWNGEIPDCVHQNHLIRVRPGPDVLPRYLNWYWNSPLARPHIESLARTTSGLYTLSTSKVRGVPVILPPSLDEQRAIVDVIDRTLSHLHAASSTLDNGQGRTGQLLRSILFHAFLSRSPSTEAIAAAERAFGSEWQRRRPTQGRGRTRPPEVIDTGRIASQWAGPVMSLDALCDPSRPICYGILKPRGAGGEDVPYVEVRDMRHLPLRVDALPRTSREADEEYARSRLREGDVVLAIRGSYDVAAVVPAEVEGANVSRDVARIAPLPGLDPRFLAYFLQSPHAQRYFDAVARGVAVRGINIKHIRQLPVPVLPLDDQLAIVAEADARISQLRHVAGALAHGRERAALLRRAVLKSAFEGQLAYAREQQTAPSGVEENVA